MTKTIRAFETIERDQFAAIVRACHADGSLRAYGRLAGFGRVLITDQFRVNYAAWIDRRPSMNIHRAA